MFHDNFDFENFFLHVLIFFKLSYTITIHFKRRLKKGATSNLNANDKKKTHQVTA